MEFIENPTPLEDAQGKSEESNTITNEGEFKALVQTYMDNKSDIKDIKASMSVLTKKQTQWSKQILSYMKEKKIPRVTVPGERGGTIVLESKNSQSPKISEDYVAKKIETYFQGDDDKIRQLMKFIYLEGRKTVTRQSLKFKDPPKPGDADKAEKKARKSSSGTKAKKGEWKKYIQE